MKVGMLTASLSQQGGGVSYAVNALSRSLPASSVDVSLFGGLPTRGPSGFAFMPGMLPAMHAADLDILHVHGLWMYPSIAGRKWSSAKGRPHIVSPHGMLDPWALANSRWKKRLAWTLFEHGNLARAACLHALTEAEALAMRRIGLTNPIAVIPNGIDMPSARPDWPPPDWLRCDDRKLLLFLGRLHPKKGLLQLAESWARLAKRSDLTKRWVLAIGGWDDGGHLRSLEAAIRAHGLESDILLPGPLYGEAKEVALRHARAFVLPSLSEGLPIAVLEAWSYGLPVFMTQACGVPEGFDRGAAFEISVDPGAMADTFASTLGDAAALSAAGARGRELARQRFEWAHIAAEMTDVYRWLAGSAPRPTTIL
jgi:glycosyltransferase involved in cell wall biosynthesis